MSDTVECPCCHHENDMSDGLVDLSSDCKFDYECDNCEREFEVFVEFNPSYYVSEIVHANCEKCEKKTRNCAKRGSIFPFSKSLSENIVCEDCFHKGLQEDYGKEVSRS